MRMLPTTPLGWERELDRLAASYREVLAVAAGAPAPRRVDELSVYASQ